ncbi:MAG: primosomal protein N' [Clostridia bacterium]
MFAEVIVDVQNSAVDRVFDYLIDESSFTCQAGSRVEVFFGNRKIEGFVVAIKDKSLVPAEKIKPIFKVLDFLPAITKEMLNLCGFMCKEFHLKRVSVLRLFLPAQMRGGKVKDKQERYFVVNDEIDLEKEKLSTKKQAKSQIAILEYFQCHKEEKSSILTEKFSPASIKALVDKNILKIKFSQVSRNPDYTKKSRENFVLTKMQQNAVNCVDLNLNKTYLLHGVTGSGKTEVYLNLISKAVNNGKSAIMLVPEIALTPQMFSLFKSRFGDNVAIIHSSLSVGERYDEWNRIRNGKAKIVIGARSAIFAPIENVGIVIIDEEHEQSYISESDPRYDTHTVADFRAKFNNCPLVLGSATPSISSYSKAIDGEFKLLELPERINGKNLPSIQIVDMLDEIRHGNNSMFSCSLKSVLDECIASKKQAMIFLNRRGFTSFVMCTNCGYVAKCSDCDVSLVYHKEENRLKCHFCGKRFKMLTNCPQCNSEKLRHGAVGTEQVVYELNKLFPNVKILRMDNDTTSIKNAHQKILGEFASTLPAILVGTQMIAKGHDFKDVTLVGIIDADQGLYQSDYRSSERTFALITQVSGRAGRADSDGKVILQTYNPRHYVFKYAANYFYKGFFEKEFNLRKVTLFPPFTKIIRILISGENEENVRQTLQLCYNEIKDLKIKNSKDFVFLEVMKSPVSRIKNKFRYQILMRIKKENESFLTEQIYAISDKYLANNISIFVEINPQNLS